jgi:hypothetical protein
MAPSESEFRAQSSLLTIKNENNFLSLLLTHRWPSVRVVVVVVALLVSLVLLRETDDAAEEECHAFVASGSDRSTVTQLVGHRRRQHRVQQSALFQ